MLSFSANINAKHIISGAMSYECMGDGNYDLTMIIYRDCSCTNCGSIDDPASISVYSDGELTQLINVEVESIQNIEPESYENCNFADYCVEKGTYYFSLSLPNDNLTYSIVYQRCCWSNSIANILNPEENGISIMTQISSKAQELCNTQPTYDGQFALVTCPNTNVALDLPKFDEEGDSLAVRLCLPFLGGGREEASQGCDGVIPRGACPPPYDEIPLVEGFDVNNPFPTENGITIDPETNTISFIPTLLGRYVFSVCFTEYRDGEILSEFRSNLETQIKSNLVDAEENFLAQDLQVFYADGSLHIESDIMLNNAEIYLSDLRGSMLQHTKIEYGNKRSIDVPNLASGIYILSLREADGRMLTKKVPVLH